MLIGIILVGIIAWLIFRTLRIRRQHAAEDRTFAGQHGGWDIYKSPYERGILALDHEDRMIAIGTVGAYADRPWSDISAVEIERNGESLIQTDRGSQVVGAAVGALLLGPVGLLMGSLTGPRRQKQRVNELSLKVLVDDRSAPVHRIVFFREKGKGIDAKSKLLKAPAARLEHYHALVANALRSDNRSFATQVARPSIESSSADRIAKLWDLRQAGALTDEEFAAEKGAILGVRQLPGANSSV